MLAQKCERESFEECCKIALPDSHCQWFNPRVPSGLCVCEREDAWTEEAAAKPVEATGQEESPRWLEGGPQGYAETALWVHLRPRAAFKIGSG